MTAYEKVRVWLDPLFTPLHCCVRRLLADLIPSDSAPLNILDIGGRRSPYTIRQNAMITIIDLPRLSSVQNALGLGLDESTVQTLLRTRSNVQGIVLDDMTHSKFSDASFDAAIAVEVLEHVDEDGLFLDQVARVVRPGGWFLMTTPNGDFIPNVGNPDHRRHYRKKQLESLLEMRFSEVHVAYGVRSGFFHKLGLASWSMRHPIETAVGMAGNLIANIQSVSRKLGSQAEGTEHLIAVARVAPRRPEAG